MSVQLWLAIASVVIAGVPTTMTLLNLRRYRVSRRDAPADDDRAPVGICIPARNEEDNLAACVESILAGDDERVRVYVYDDQSSDRTPEILAELARRDRRVTAVETVALPDGWNGKQHACWRAARRAIDDGCAHLLFTDADVRFSPDAIRRTRAEQRRLDADLISTFPRQITGSISEAALVPMIFFILLGYLPMGRMRRSRAPEASAGCGQFLFVSARCYDAFGGHEAFRATMHDGIMMPRAARRAGFRSDLFDGTDLARVRMYRGLRQTWMGFAKNAYEGLGSPVLLVVLTGMHLLGQIGPWLYAPAALVGGEALIGAIGLGAIALQIGQRLVLARRFRQGLLPVLLHPLGVAGMTAIQWHSFVLHQTGRRSWRGRRAR